MRLQFVVLVIAVALALVVVEALRRRRLSEGWALLWIGVALAGVALVVARPLVDRFAESLGIAYGTSLVFSLAIVFLLVVCINLSVQVSRLNQRVERLAQELALDSVQRSPQAWPADSVARPEGDEVPPVEPAGS